MRDDITSRFQWGQLDLEHGGLNPGYAIFIDEAGDPGIRSVRPVVPNGASEWFTMSALVIDQSRDADTVQWVREIKEAVRQVQRPDFHYNRLSLPSRRQLAAERLARLPCRLFVVVSHKPNMHEFRNPRAEKIRSQNFFYNWVMRILLERATGWCRAHSIERHGEVRRARLVMSATGGLDYGQLIAYHQYLRFQSQGSGPFLNARNIAWDVLHPDLYEPVPHISNAGVQLADIGASAFYQAANAAAPAWDLKPALALRPILPTNGHRAADCGLTLMPLKKTDRIMSLDQQQIFRAYGFDFGG